jgi:hypothetical protein
MLWKFDVRPHRGQMPVGSQLSGGVSGFGVLLNPLVDMVAPAVIAVVGTGAKPFRIAVIDQGPAHSARSSTAMNRPARRSTSLPM